MRFNPESKSFKLFQALRNGEALTEAQISARFGLKNPTATISSLRLNHGVCIYADEHSRVTLAPSSATLAPSSADSYINANSVPVA